jgi:hypothetical protein
LIGGDRKRKIIRQMPIDPHNRRTNRRPIAGF